MWKKQRKSPEQKMIKRIAESIELPMEVLEGLPELELRGNREAIVSHCVSILEYNDQRVRIASNQLTIQFSGRNLSLTRMTDESIMLTGFILKMEFLGF